MTAVDTPITVLFGHLCTFAKELEKDVAVLADPSGIHSHALYSGNGLPIIEHIHTTTANAAAHLQNMLNCCNPSMSSILHLCQQLYKENEQHIDTVEKQLERYGYKRVAEDRQSLYSHDATEPPAKKRLSSVQQAMSSQEANASPWHPKTQMFVEPAGPKTPTLEECGGISETTLALLSARHQPKTPVLDAKLLSKDLAVSFADTAINRKLFAEDLSQPEATKTEVSEALEGEMSTLSASLLWNRSTIHPLVEEITEEEFRRELPTWLQDLMGRDVQAINKYIKMINDYVTEKWFQMEDESKETTEVAHALTKEELEKLIGLPEKTSKGLLMCLKYLRRLIAKQHGTETHYYLK